jgi:hypothetical protein
LNSIIDSEWLDKALSVLRMGQLKPCILIIEFIGRVPLSASVFQNILHALGPTVFEKGTDTRDTVRQAALDTVYDWYAGLYSHSKTHALVMMKKELEDEVVKNLSGKNPKAKEFALDLLSKFLSNKLSDFWSDLVPCLVSLLNDSVELVRKMAKELLDELSHYQDRGLLKVIQKELIDQNIKSKIAKGFIDQKVESVISF